MAYKAGVSPVSSGALGRASVKASDLVKKGGGSQFKSPPQRMPPQTDPAQRIDPPIGGRDPRLLGPPIQVGPDPGAGSAPGVPSAPFGFRRPRRDPGFMGGPPQGAPAPFAGGGFGAEGPKNEPIGPPLMAMGGAPAGGDPMQSATMGGGPPTLGSLAQLYQRPAMLPPNAGGGGPMPMDGQGPDPRQIEALRAAMMARSGSAFGSGRGNMGDVPGAYASMNGGGAQGVMGNNAGRGAIMPMRTRPPRDRWV